MDPQALTELIPDWKEKGAPLDTAVTEDKFLFLTKEKSLATPSWLLPDCFRNHGNYIVRLGNVARWLGEQRSEEHTSELQSLMRISYAVFCLKKKNKH